MNPKNEVQLARSVVQKSNMLAIQLYPEILSITKDMRIGTWRITYPEFRRPELYVRGHDVSEEVYAMGKSTSDLLVELRHMEEQDDDDFGPQPRHYAFNISPAGSYDGLGLLLLCPVEMSDSPATLRNIRGWGSLGLDYLSWRGLGEIEPDKSRKENVMLRLIEIDSIESLRFTAWFLDGLMRGREIYKEEVKQIY